MLFHCKTGVTHATNCLMMTTNIHYSRTNNYFASLFIDVSTLLTFSQPLQPKPKNSLSFVLCLSVILLYISICPLICLHISNLVINQTFLFLLDLNFTFISVCHIISRLHAQILHYYNMISVLNLLYHLIVSLILFRLL